LDAIMTKLVPGSTRMFDEPGRANHLNDLLAGIMEYTGALAGWIGLHQADGRIYFPLALGEFPSDWLAKQQGKESLWGFTFQEESPTLVNDLAQLPGIKGAPLKSILSCPVFKDGKRAGQIVLANKPGGFQSPDALVLQMISHLISRHLLAFSQQAKASNQIVFEEYCKTLECLEEGVIAVEPGGEILFVNGAFLKRAGFERSDLVGCLPPYPFWISHRALYTIAREFAAQADLMGREPVLLPFRRKDDTVFWCLLKSSGLEIGGRTISLIFAKEASTSIEATRSRIADLPAEAFLKNVVSNLPFATALCDLQGRFEWTNKAFEALISSPTPSLGRNLSDFFCSEPPDDLVDLLTLQVEPRASFGHIAFLSLQPQEANAPMAAYWIRGELSGRHCYVFCIRENVNNRGASGKETVAETNARSNVTIPTLVLGVVPGQEINYWDRRWEELTGLSKADLRGVPSELVLDWLIPNQADRDLVADLFHHRPTPSRSMVLDILTPHGSSPFACTWIPVQSIEGESSWIVLLEEVKQAVGKEIHVPQFGRSFVRGLSQLLNHHLLKVMDLSERGMAKADLSTGVLNSFEQILDACQRFAQLLDHLECLAMVAVADLKVVSLNDLISEFVEEQAGRIHGMNYELTLDLLPEESPVRVVPRLLKMVLKHLLTNAEQAFATSPTKRITISVIRTKDDLICSIADTGEGLPTENWPVLLNPFVSTKGPFAHETAAATLEATGLGLTVSQHLLKLQGGRLELRKGKEGGAVASFSLPCVSPQTGQGIAAGGPKESVRADQGERAHGPHDKGGLAQVPEAPFSKMLSEPSKS
jgi:signal transduction histidine kinase